MRVKIHPLNAKGKYYVDQNVCLLCADCEFLAPNNFKFDGNIRNGSHVCKQPETPEEEAQCKEAMRCCAVEAIYNDGDKYL